MSKYCVGIDIGGTTVKCGLFTTEGVLKEKWEVPTRKEDNGANILPDVAVALKEKLKEADVALTDVIGIGMGVPGPVLPNDYVAVCVNLGWKDLYPAKQMSELMDGIPCYAGNDANVAALGEMWMGGGKGYRNIVAVTLGTGVGGGVILDGKIVTGSHGLGGEIGHMHIQDGEVDACGCGGHGCLEQYASATGFAKEAKRTLAASAAPSTMRAFGEDLTCKDVCDCAKNGDELARVTVDRCTNYLGEALSLLTHVIDPERFVIGGGVSKAGPWLIEQIKKHYDAYVTIAKSPAQIVLAELGNDAGIFGAARLVLKD